MRVPVEAAHLFGAIFIASGVAAFVFNSMILYVLFKRRHSLFAHVFYILIFNFATIDLLKSSFFIFTYIRNIKKYFF